MTTRIFSKVNNLYTNSPLWPSNQRSFSDWAIASCGKVVELIYFGARNDAVVQIHESKDFIAEPWTGYFDARGKKIYRGDILGAFKGIHDEIDPSYETEVVWHEGGFYCKDEQMVPDSWMPLEMENKVWKRHFIKTTIHGVEYFDV